MPRGIRVHIRRDPGSRLFIARALEFEGLVATGRTLQDVYSAIDQMVEEFRALAIMTRDPRFVAEEEATP